MGSLNALRPSIHGVLWTLEMIKTLEGYVMIICRGCVWYPSLERCKVVMVRWQIALLQCDQQNIMHHEKEDMNRRLSACLQSRTNPVRVSMSQLCFYGSIETCKTETLLTRLVIFLVGRQQLTSFTLNSLENSMVCPGVQGAIPSLQNRYRRASLGAHYSQIPWLLGPCFSMK